MGTLENRVFRVRPRDHFNAQEVISFTPGGIGRHRCRHGQPVYVECRVIALP